MPYDGHLETKLKINRTNIKILFAVKTPCFTILLLGKIMMKIFMMLNFRGVETTISVLFPTG